ncbi:MAG: hypothetical protein QOD41_4983 [Cryptosporangiaceae bacterium]|nr:hypothetical protein [Cryptosporangiaceae bacterium]
MTESERRGTHVPGWVIFTVTAVTVVLGVGGWALQRPTQYVSSAVVAITPKAVKPVSAGVVTQAAPRYVAFATSPYVLRHVGAALKVDPLELGRGTVVTMTAATANITISVTLNNQDDAAKAANALAAEIVQRSTADPILAAQSLSDGIPSSTSVGPHPLVLIGAGGAAGLLAGAAAWTMTERYRRRRASVARGVAAVGLPGTPIEGPTMDIRALGIGAETQRIPLVHDQIRIDS